jgi:hypothetical protein
MRHLKVYGWIGHRREYNHNGHHQTRECMAAHSKAEVMRVLNVRASDLFDFSETGNREECAVAMAKPLVNFWRGLDDYRGTYIESKRTK